MHIFAAFMRKLYYILLLLLFPLCSFSDVVVTLRSGSSLTGNIVFQNDEVVVIKSQEGQRFQYPMSEVESIREAEISIEEVIEEEKPVSAKKVGISLNLSGGASFMPHETAGGSVGAEVFIGACNLFNKHIFIGGGIGYSGFFISPASGTSRVLSFIPVELRFSAPLMQTAHAPAIGCSIGYGFSPKGIDRGGLTAALDFGWRWQMTEKHALFAGLGFAFQQGKTEVAEIVDGNEYVSLVVRNLCRIGAKVAVQF